MTTEFERNPDGAEGVTHPSRTTWSCWFKAARPAGTSSWDMDFNMASLDDPACRDATSKQHRRHADACPPHRSLENDREGKGQRKKTPTPKFHIILMARGKLLREQQVRGRTGCSPSSFSSTTQASSFWGANGAAASYTAALEPFPIWFPMT